MADESNRLDKGSAARLLSDWRAAERDSVAARASAEVASLAAAAAQTAEQAALETAEAARLALDAATRAEQAARATADAARIVSSTTAAEKVASDEAVTQADAAEAEARDAFHTAQDAGFPAATTETPKRGS